MIIDSAAIPKPLMFDSVCDTHGQHALANKFYDVKAWGVNPQLGMFYTLSSRRSIANTYDEQSRSGGAIIQSIAAPGSRTFLQELGVQKLHVFYISAATWCAKRTGAAASVERRRREPARANSPE